MSRPAAAEAGIHRRARAFGLEISLDFDAPGLADASGPPAGPHCRVDLVDRNRIDHGWPASGTRRLLEERLGPGAPDRTIDAHPRAGYRLYARHFGLARLSAHGARVLCSPPGVAPWRWQRFLVGRVLPWAAVLRGLEALHASAVVIDGRAIAFVGATGAGKTSLAVQLVARGADFLTDDVLALDQHRGMLRAHPGAALAAVRPDERAAVARAVWRRIGPVVGRADKTYVALPPAPAPVPLAALYFLSTGAGPAIRTIARPDPRLVLGNTFVVGLQTPERLCRQLDVAAALARTSALFELSVDLGTGSAELAARVGEHARSVVAGTREHAA